MGELADEEEEEEEKRKNPLPGIFFEKKKIEKKIQFWFIFI